MSEPFTRLNAALEGRYHIVRQLGEGGMATVYLADDLRHERRVALKVLKPELAAVVGAERFLAEIKTTANLQHPHILPLFDSGEADGFLYYVMPYVEGESLRERLDREHQLPVGEAVRITENVAEALDYAHSHGVIHRDIKPANILLQAGKPVVSDFGIALAVGAAGGAPLTETGLSLGTPHYMSPEQAAGDATVGPATDIYALACVLYEMLVGEPPYTGRTAQAVLGKIITAVPDRVTTHRRSVPANVEAAIERGLEKLAADRFSAVRDFSTALADPSFRHSNPRATEFHGAPTDRWKRLSVVLAVTTVVLGVATFLRPLTPRRSAVRDGAVFRTPLTGFDLRAAPNSGNRLAISDDGSLIALVSTVDGVTKIYLRRADETEFRAVPGTESSLDPGFSPDGQWLVFERDNAIYRVEVSGGPVLEVTQGIQPHWGLPDVLAFRAPDGISIVDPFGGQPAVVVPGAGAGRPHLLPGGRRVVYEARSPEGSALRSVDIESGEVVDLGVVGRNPRYVPTGHLLYGHESQALMAVRFDPDAQRVLDEPTSVLSDVLVFGGGATQIAVSQTGTLIYGRAGPSGGRRDLVTVDLGGRIMSLPLGGGAYRTPRYSPPDGRRIAYDMEDRIWVYDLESGRNTALTTLGDTDYPAAWSRDGRDLYFASVREGTEEADIFRLTTDGSATEAHVFRREGRQYPLSASPDGTQLLVEESTTERGWDLLFATEGEDGWTLTDYLRADWNESMGAISPDGRWVAYVSDESSADEVYVRSFPDGRNQQAVSRGGGIAPVWAPDGGAVYYLAGGSVMRASFSPDGIGEPRMLFEGGWATTGSIPMTNWDVHPDGRSFVFVRNPSTTTGGAPSGVPIVPVEIVVNWFTELRERVPTARD